MDRRHENFSQFNPRRYEGSLSLFGRKVLDKLIKKWTSDRNRAREAYSSHQPRMPPPNYHRPQQSMKELTFLSKEPLLTQPSPIACDIDEISNENNISNKLFYPTEKQLPVLTTNELFKTVESTKIINIEDVNVHGPEIHVSTYNMINPVNGGNQARNMMCDLNNRTDNNDNDKINLKDTTSIDNELTSITRPRVNWDDMFDAELLPDVATNAKLKIQLNAATNATEKSFKIFGGINDCDYTKEDYKATKTIEIKHNDTKKAKRKTQPKVTDDIPKKVKKVDDNDKPKTSFRKQKYTTSVNNWLIDVDPKNPVEEEVTREYKDNIEKILVGITSNSDETDIKTKTANIVFEKANKVGNSDKVKQKPKVQTQLANRDGKMKFGKPEYATKAEINSDKIENDKTDQTKTKKTKSKFVVPIKSQVPVKDVDYVVVTVDDTNIQELIESFRLMENKDILIVLVYSNGFSQLNKHHTEDSCDPEGFITKVEQEFFYFKGNHQGFKQVIGTLLESNNVICYEGKSLLIYFESKFSLGFRKFNLIDAKIGGSLLDPDNPPENFSDLQKLLSYVPQYTIATECILQKTAWYATLLDECGVRLTTLLKENGLWTVFMEIEMKLMPIIAEMEHRGVTVDLLRLKSMEDILLSHMKEVEQECYKVAGRNFQLNSAVQIRAIIYDELQLDTKCNVKIKETICKGAKSTSETMLRSLLSVHPLPKLILEYRHLHKAHATFLTGIAQQVNDGIVKPTWVQTAAATGRMASHNPNLQAIPKAPFSLILFPDVNNSGTGNQTLNIRSVYTSRHGYSLVCADFQHVECRVFAHCAGDTLLLSLLQAGGDLFRALAAKWMNKLELDVTSEDRERTKRMVYASLYGAGCKKLMDIFGTSYEQTLSIIASFNRTFPSLKSFGRSVVTRCEQNGGLSTLCGRARRFKNITSQDFQLKSQAERQAVNFVVQGSAADLCKLAMVLTSARLRSHQPPVDGCLLLQIHDELVWEVRDEHLHIAAAIVKEVMEGCGRHCGMTMSLPVSISTGHTWGEMTEYTPPVPT